MGTFRHNLKQIQLGGNTIQDGHASHPDNLADILKPYQFWINNNEDDPAAFTVGDKGNIVRITGDKLTEETFDSLMARWWKKDENGDIYSEHNVYSLQGMSALGRSTGGSGGGNGGVTSLGGLVNVDPAVDDIFDYDIITYKPAGATHFTSKKLSEVVGLDKPALSAYLTENGYVTKTWVNEQGFLKSVSWDSINNKPTTFTPSAHKHTVSDITDFPTQWAWSAISGKPSTFYTLPNASASVLGGVKVGSGLAIDANGILSANLSASHIPGLDASKIISGTLADARIPSLSASKITSGTFDVERIPTLGISKISGLQTALDNKLNVSTFDALFTPIYENGVLKRIQANFDFYSVGGMSALGWSEGGTGTGSGLIQQVHAYGELGGTFSNTNLTSTFNAYTTNQIHLRVKALEESTPLTFVSSGTGNVITGLSKAGNIVTYNLGLTALTGITKAMVEAVLTGNITSHTHNYLSAITKAQVEAVLTGVITSHSHTITWDSINGKPTVFYTLPEATASVLGGVKVGSGLAASSGLLSVNLAASHIPSLDASKITTGVFADARIPSLDASKITSGTLPIARGGTGKTSIAANAMYYASAANVLSEVTTSAFGRGLLNSASGTLVSGLNSQYLNGIANTGYARGYGSYGFGGSYVGVTTADFIETLTSIGAFDYRYFVVHGSWWHAGNYYINDTGIANIHLSGAVVEVMSRTSDATEYTIRITLPYANSTGITRRCFILSRQGAGGVPEWREMLTGYNGNIQGTYNATSATKLQTARTIWGQTFDGTGNVSGAITGATSISMAGALSGATTGAFSSNVTIGGTLSIVGLGTFTNGININNRLTIHSSGYIYPYSTSTRRAGMYGAYDSAKIGHVWSMGTSYMIADDGSSFGNLYGMAYAHSNSGLHLISSQHQILFVNNGTANVAIGLEGVIRAKSYITSDARIFTGYDSGIANSISCSGWFRSNNATGWLNATYSAGILSDEAGVVRTYSTNRFKIYSTAASSTNTSNAFYCAGGGAFDGNLWSKGGVSALGTSTSDMRLKENIRDFNGLSILRKIKPFRFDWNEKGLNMNSFLTNEYNVGISAQKTEKILPNFVGQFNGDYLFVKYEKFIPIVMKGVLEVDDKVTRLEKRVSALEKENEQLRNQLKQIAA